MTRVLSITDWIIKITKWTGLLSLVVMMLLISASVLLRLLGIPFIGSVDSVRLLMVVTIACSLSYSESQRGHIEVDLFFEKFPKPVQRIIMNISHLMSLLVLLTIAIVYFKVSYSSIVNGSLRATEMIGIPFYPFEVIIAIGFTAWFIQKIIMIFKKEEKIDKNNDVLTTGNDVNGPY